MLQRKKNEATLSEIWKIMKLANTHLSKEDSLRVGGILINKACVYTRMISKWHWNDFLIHFSVGRRRVMNKKELTKIWQTKQLSFIDVSCFFSQRPDSFFISLEQLLKFWCFSMHLLYKKTPPLCTTDMVIFKISEKKFCLQNI